MLSAGFALYDVKSLFSFKLLGILRTAIPRASIKISSFSNELQKGNAYNYPRRVSSNFLISHILRGPGPGPPHQSAL